MQLRPVLSDVICFILAVTELGSVLFALYATFVNVREYIKHHWHWFSGLWFEYIHISLSKGTFLS